MANPKHPVTRAMSVVRKALLVNALPGDLVDPHISIERARALFSTYVDQVEIENHGFCNRVCWFCPNTMFDRRTRLDPMSDAVFERIVSDLESIGYDGTLTWSRYAEALASDTVFDRVRQARERLPNATLMMISNGDYMRRDTLPRLEAFGLDRLILDLYLPEGRERDPDAIAAGVARFERRTGVTLEETAPFDYRGASASLKVTLEVPNYSPEFISTRGGLVDVPKRSAYRRRAVCIAPVRHLAIDWNGKAMMCCQTRSDAPEHADAVIGDLSVPGYGLFHYYRDLATVRRGLLAPGEKGGACLTCDVRDDGPDRLARREWIARPVEWLPGASAAAASLWRRSIRRRFVG